MKETTRTTRRMGYSVLWYDNVDRRNSELNYKDGKEDGLFVSRGMKAGRRRREGNYKDDKEFVVGYMCCGFQTDKSASLKKTIDRR